jgi:hypothetical protein
MVSNRLRSPTLVGGRNPSDPTGFAQGFAGSASWPVGGFDQQFRACGRGWKRIIGPFQRRPSLLESYGPHVALFIPGKNCFLIPTRLTTSASKIMPRYCSTNWSSSPPHDSSIAPPFLTIPHRSTAPRRSSAPWRSSSLHRVNLPLRPWPVHPHGSVSALPTMSISCGESPSDHPWSPAVSSLGWRRFSGSAAPRRLLLLDTISIPATDTNRQKVNKSYLVYYLLISATHHEGCFRWSLFVAS